MKILLVEDDLVQAETTKIRLRKKVEQIDHAADGPSAVKMAKEQSEAGSPYDLIFMDIGLPVFNGIEAARQIIENDPSAKIVGLSANYSSEEEKCLDAGMLGGALKPLSSEKLSEFLKFVA